MLVCCMESIFHLKKSNKSNEDTNGLHNVLIYSTLTEGIFKQRLCLGWAQARGTVMAHEMCNFLSAPPLLGTELSRLCTANRLSREQKSFNAPACLWSAIPPLNIRPNFFCHFSTIAALRRKPSAQLETGLQ